jgi:very-short-patch-repair endonuclease
MRGLRRVFKGVCAVGDLTELGWYMAAALAGGTGAAISHLSALQLMGLRPTKPGPIHVTLAKRGGIRERDGIVPHRPRTAPELWKYKGIPITSPTQSLEDADLKPHELYRALEQADRRNVKIHLLDDVVRLKQTVTGTTRSDTEAAFLFLCHDNGLELPLVNQILNGYETDFHWPERKLVVEVDGFEHHRERREFNNDRYRGLAHRAEGWEVVRVSADHVYDEPALVLRALDVGRPLVA